MSQQTQEDEEDSDIKGSEDIVLNLGIRECDAFVDASRDKHNGILLSLVLIVAAAQACMATVELCLQVACHSDVHQEAIVIVIHERHCDYRGQPTASCASRAREHHSGW